MKSKKGRWKMKAKPNKAWSSSGRKHSKVKIQRQQKNSLTSIHGMGIGAGIMAIGWLVAVSVITITGILIFVPSAGMALSKYLKKHKKH